MERSENINILKELVKNILEKMTFSNFTLGVREEAGPNGENIVFNIGSRESDLLIGQHGANLRALQHLLRAMARRKIEQKVSFSIDVNDYQKEKLTTLAKISRDAALKAVEEKKAIILRPMSAYERRIVHMELADNEQVKTESIGEGEERKVVIRPTGNTENGSTKEFSNININEILNSSR